MRCVCVYLNASVHLNVISHLISLHFLYSVVFIPKTSSCRSDYLVNISTTHYIHILCATTLFAKVTNDTIIAAAVTATSITSYNRLYIYIINIQKYAGKRTADCYYHHI